MCHKYAISFTGDKIRVFWGAFLKSPLFLKEVKSQMKCCVLYQGEDYKTGLTLACFSLTEHICESGSAFLLVSAYFTAM